MKSVPVIPSNAPFTTEQRAWLNGFLAGVFASESGTGPEAAAAAKPAEPLLVMFGSQTGGAEGLAKRFAKEASAKGFAPRLLPLNDFEKAELTKATKLVVISSTWGDGEPPDNAVNFWSWLSSETVPRFENLHFAVLGLGDKNYADFCGASKKFDARFEFLGAKRLIPRAECDVDYETVAKAWMENLWLALGNVALVSKQVPVVAGDALAPVTTDREPTKANKPAWTRANPFPARLKTNRLLNQPGSAKDTRHFEIVLEGSGLSYEVGDALGVMPQNCPVLVEDLLAALGFKGEEIVKDAKTWTGRCTRRCSIPWSSRSPRRRS
jgi:sulfite reductase (NADPH) flavoprotein alpha-component